MDLQSVSGWLDGDFTQSYGHRVLAARCSEAIQFFMALCMEDAHHLLCGDRWKSHPYDQWLYIAQG